jgi:NAD(P)H-hydrate epimerase
MTTGIILQKEDVQKLLPIRKKNVHKGTAGKIMVIAGSQGMSGAAILCSRACLRSGAGIVMLAAPQNIAYAVDASNIEVMTKALNINILGSLNYSAAQKVYRHLPYYDLLIIGPGLGRKNAGFAAEIISYVSKKAPNLPVVIDADGLLGLKKILRPLKIKKMIITPHLGEMSELSGYSINYLSRHPIKVAKEVSLKYGCTVVLKSHVTYIVAPDKEDFFLNTSGNPGMATAGSGDVLTGIIGGIWISNRLSTIDAASIGPYIHAAAGNIAAKNLSMDGIIASDILESVPAVMKSIKGV